MLILLLSAIFYITYAILVENPFTAQKLSLSDYVSAWMSLSNDTLEARVMNIPLGLLATSLGYIAIWVVRRILSDVSSDN